MVFGALYGVDYYSNYKIYSQERANEKYAKDLEKQYMEDTYGGKTPEETLALFIDALKKGDTDLAAKYVVIDEQGKVRADLLQAKTTGNLNKVIERLGLLKKSKAETNEASFVIFGEDHIVKYQILLGKNPNSVWKILEL